MLPEPVTILIVDDDRGGREALEALLLTQGYNLILASNGPEALQKLEEAPIDLIMLDLMMPGMDGYEVCRRIRNNPAVADIPILILTAMNDFRSRLAGIEVGADDYITKPYDSMELFARVRTVSRLNRYRRLVSERLKFQQLFELSPNGQLVIDSNGVVQLINKKLLQMVNIGAPDEIVGSALAGWITPDRQAEFKTQLDNFWKDPETICHHETWLAGKNKMIQPVEMVLGQIEFNNNIMVQVILIDIRERMQLSGALAKERTLLKALMDTFPDFVFCKDLDARFLMVNPALAQFFGISSPEEAIGKTDFDYYPKELAVRYLSDEQHLLNTGRPILDQEEAMVDSKGVWHWVSTLKAPLHNRSGELIGIIGIGRDITRQKNATIELNDVQIELEASRRKIAELKQSVSDLDRERIDYLSYLGNELDRLGKEIIEGLRFLDQANEAQHTSALLVQQTAMQLASLAQDIVTYSTLVKQATPIETTRFSLLNCIHSAEQQVRERALQKGLSIGLSLDPELPEFASGDGKGFGQVLVRLLDNAVRSSESGVVSLRVEMENYSVSVPNEAFYIHASVSDTGPGIAKESMVNLFKPFQMPVRGVIINGDSGLSLAICKQLVELSGGRIWAESNAIPGVGCTFHFNFRFQAA
ncbi:MAG TPA: response regulator [Anaerolineaceae bacterium]|nr:response regulator [Anaerolineaceae bacterium]